MRNIFIKLLIAIIFIFCCDVKLLAQWETVDSLAKEIGKHTQDKNLDKNLSKNQTEIFDSLVSYKKDKDFAYMKYLDSLLRQTKDLKVDTFSVDNSDSVKPKTRSYTNSVNPQSNFLNQPLVKIILWVLAILLIGFIIYKLFAGENFFKRNRTYKNVLNTQKEDENIADPSHYNKLITQAVINKNYRLAIRYSYLQALQRLSGNGAVQLAADKTNYQYVSELQGKSYQNEFAAITLNYEYVWYGKFEISEDVYKKLADEYKLFHKKI